MELSKPRYTEEQLDQIEALVRELLAVNEDQNAKLIAMNAKLQNEEAKVKLQQKYISQLEMVLTTNKNEA